MAGRMPERGDIATKKSAPLINIPSGETTPYRSSLEDRFLQNRPQRRPGRRFTSPIIEWRNIRHERTSIRNAQSRSGQARSDTYGGEHGASWLDRYWMKGHDTRVLEEVLRMPASHRGVSTRQRETGIVGSARTIIRHLGVLGTGA